MDVCVKKWLFLFLFLVYACEHYPSNVEVVYKNSNAHYKNNGKEFSLSEDFSEESKITKTEEKPKEIPPERKVIEPLTKSKPQEEPVVIENKTSQAQEKPKTTEQVTQNDVPIEEPQNQQERNPNLNDSYKTNNLQGEYHVVQKGETYYSIARLYFLKPQDLTTWNDYKKGDVLKAGTIIKLYQGKDEGHLLTETENLSIAKEANAGKASNLKIVPAKPAAGKIADKSCFASLIMPIKNNNYLSKYGQNTSGGVRQDGVVFSVKKVDSVVATLNGEVVYVGDGFSDYGNIVIVKHLKNYFSIYGHLKDVKVKKGQHVSQGEVISKTNINDGKFYFSIRRGKIPMDPLKCIKA